MEVDLICQDCGEEMDNVNVTEWQAGDVVECEACGAEHEVTSLEPFSMVLIEEEK